MNRREFITLLAGTASVWPLTARAQQGDRMRRIGVLMPGGTEDAVYQVRLGALVQSLEQLGWASGRNVTFDIRWATTDRAEIRRHAAELAALAPDVIVAYGAGAVAGVLQATRIVPVVFPVVTDPVAAGFVESLARPGGNVTGFMSYEYSLGGKWVEILKQIAPGLTRVAVLRDSGTPTGIGLFGAMQAAAASLRVEVSAVNAYNAEEIERAVAALESHSSSGMIVPSGGLTQRYRTLIIARAERHKIPAVYHERAFITAGGLVSYGPDYVDQFRRAAGYVDRILKGEKPADLPVQAPTRYELVINLKTAKALGLEIPPTVLARADEVIE